MKIKTKVSYFLVFLFSINIYPQNSDYISKQGGILFRVDDNHPISEYLQYADVFKKYNQHFCFALNLDITNINSEYVAGIKQLQANGNEMMDHTPSHKTNFFYTILNTNYFINNPGVEQIDGNKVKLKHKNVDINDAKRSGYVNIDGDIVTNSSGIFSTFSKKDCYLYFPSLDKLVYINDYSNNWIDENTVKITDVWNGTINLGSHQNIQFYNFDNKNVHLTIDAIKALAEETQRLADYYGLERPSAWIQPGGYFPMAYRSETKQACETKLGYQTAGVFSDPSIKVFNEYNPNNDKQFGMSWGDFYDDTWTLEECKTSIADRVAKHLVAIGHSHFSDLLGGWEGFLERTENIIQWCIDKNIPIRTYSEWSDILYKQTPDPLENIFPSLSIDKDNNSYPDGFFNNSKISSSEWVNYEGQWIQNDGVPESNNHSFSINKIGNICFVGRYYYYKQDGLGGLEKGENEFEIWTKGAQGNFIEVDFKIGANHLIYKFPAENTDWTKFNLSQSINGNTSLIIPESISTIDVTIRCSDFTSGTVKISGMSLAKSLHENDYLNVSPDSTLVNSDSGTVDITIQSKSNWEIHTTTNWVHSFVSDGKGNRTVSINYMSNPDSLERISFIHIENQKYNKEIKFLQEGLKYFTILALPDTSIAGIVQGAGRYSQGSETTLIAKPNEGYKFKYWVEDTTIVCLDSVYTFIVNSSRNLIANFQKTPTGIDFKNTPEIKFNLFQNYPNPFNPTTIIKYSIKLPPLAKGQVGLGKHVTLKIYDVLGSEITTLVNKTQQPGYYEVIFNPLSVNQRMPSGVYYYQIKISNPNYLLPFVKTKKMIYLR